MSGKGVVSFISNHSWISRTVFRRAAATLSREFDKFWFDCMNGDSRETGKLTPDGKPDPSVFSTDFIVGIRVVRPFGSSPQARAQEQPTVRFRHVLGHQAKTRRT